MRRRKPPGAFWATVVCVLVVGCTSTEKQEDLSLNAGWTFQDSSGVWRSAQVPGCIHTDLLSHGLIPDPFGGQHEKDVEWIEHRDWRFRRPLPLPPAEGEWALEFGGLDTHAELQVNGRTVLNTNNMHRTWRLPVAELGLTGQDTLDCLLYTSPSPRDATLSRMPSSA